MEFVILDETTYQEYADHCPYRNIWQSIEMTKIRVSNGWTAHYVSLQENDIIIAACALVSYPVFKKYKLFQSLRGFLLDYENTEVLTEFHDHLISYMKKQHGIYFSMDPYVVHMQRDKYGRIVEDGVDNTPLLKTLDQLGYIHEGFMNHANEQKEEPRWMFVLPIEGKQETDLLKDMNQLTKRSIKKTQRRGFTLVELKRDELSKFRDIITHTAKRKGFTNRPLSYYEKMYDIFHEMDRIKFLVIVLHTDEFLKELENEQNSERKKLMQIMATLEANPENIKSIHKKELAEEAILRLEKKKQELEQLRKKHGNEVVLSGAMFLLYGSEILYLNGGSYEETMHFSAQYRLQWEMISYAANNGYQRYNFYGIDGTFDEGKMDGVLTFKQGFSGEVEELIGVFHYILNPAVYRIYQFLKGIKDKVKGVIS